MVMEIWVLKLFVNTMSKIINIPKINNQLVELSKSDNMKLSNEQKQLKKRYRELLMLPDKFNDYFSNYCWIAHDYFDDNIMKEAISIYEKSKNIEEVDIYLSNEYDENSISKFIEQIKVSKNLHLENLPYNIATLFIKYFLDRLEIIELAKDDYLNEKYYSCIPLLLLVIDGITNDIDHEFGFFNDNINMIIENSIVGHRTGLQNIKNIVTQSRKKTTIESITIPYRNGILHGRDINYGNKIVAAKCWHILFALRDWAKENNIKNFTIENSEPKTKENIDKFINNNFQIFKNDFFNKLKEENKYHELIYFGKNPTNDYSKFYRMQELRRFLKDIVFLNFNIIEENEYKENLKSLNVEVTYKYIKKEIKKRINLLFEYSDINNKLVSIKNKNGHWKLDLSIFSSLK